MKEIHCKTGTAQLLAQTALFRGTNPENAAFALASPLCQYVSVEAGETIYDEQAFPHAVTVLISGAACCYSLNESHGTPVVLNRFSPGDVFGMAAVFSPGEAYVSRIVAERNSKMLILPQQLLSELFRRDVAVAEQYIAYLSGRVQFLNRKISGFTAGEAENRVAAYLLQLKRNPEGVSELPCNISTLSSMLNLGRASVYRAFDRLTENKVLVRSGRQITVLDEQALRQYAR